MICYDNSTPVKTLRDMQGIYKAGTGLLTRKFYLDTLMHRFGCHATVTSFVRPCSRHHSRKHGIEAEDFRSRDLPDRAACLEVERLMNEKFPLPEESRERPYCKYWDEENSGGKYPGHFHIWSPMD